MSVKIITDSTSYIEREVLNDLDIGVISLYVSFPDRSIREVDIENQEFYEILKDQGIPLSSQPTQGELYASMVDVVSKGHDLLCILLSSDMSGTYSSACSVREQVLEEYKDAKIHILDSRSNSMQLGFAAIVAARAAQEGKPLEEVIRIAEDNIKRSRFLFIPENLEYLKKGGRIGGGSALIGNILKIIPILTVEDGQTAVLKTVRTKARAIKAMLEKMLEDNVKSAIEEVVVHHINCYEQAAQLAGKIKESLTIDVPIVDIGPVIGLHVGPGAIGIVYYTKDEVGL
ncbi:MAG: DegV family protein [Firmicutes bacterium]|nr:DegV family protein [Bacillota bacterium]